MTASEIQSTLAIIKPDAFNHSEQIISLTKQAGFCITSCKTYTFDNKKVEEFYSEHKEKSFFSRLQQFMTSGDVKVMVLTAPNAIEQWRQFIGNTDSTKAKNNTIRSMFGTDKTKNAVHGSDSIESACREIDFFFADFQSPIPQVGNAAREYLATNVSPILENALTEVCCLAPKDPIEWLGLKLLRESNTNCLSTDIKIKTEEKRNIYFVLGGPGSGKGTQCSKLVEQFGFDHFSAGDLLRAEVKSQSKQGKMIDEMIREGEIVPGEITIGLLKNAIENSEAPGILIDGFPRQLDQAGAFEKEVSDFEFVLFFDCPEEEMERRLLERGKTSGRIDDNIESIKKRFRTFVKTSMPVIEYYEAKGKVHRIDATQNIEQVTQKISKLF